MGNLLKLSNQLGSWGDRREHLRWVLGALLLACIPQLSQAQPVEIIIGKAGKLSKTGALDSVRGRFSALDKNKDGQVSQTEFQADQKAKQLAGQRAFERADSDRDGALSQDEWRQSRRKKKSTAVARMRARSDPPRAAQTP